MNPDDAAAVQMVMRMDGLFLVDRDARQKQMTVEERLASRRQHLEEWAEEIRQECVKLSTSVLPKSALGQGGRLHAEHVAEAAPGFRLCGSGAVEQPGGELDATDRAGPEELAARRQRQAGPKVAAILSVVESCRRLRLPVKEYLLDVLPGLDGRKLSEIARLTPANWSAGRA